MNKPSKLFLFAYLAITCLYAADIEEMEVEKPVKNDYITKMDLTGGYLKDVGFLPLFPNLIKLDLSGVQMITIQPVVQLKHLEKLCLNNCGEILDIETLGQVTTLTNLNLNRTINKELVGRSPVSLEFLIPLINLRKLNISSNYYIFSIAPVAELPNLTHLYASCVKSLHDWDSLSNMTQLRVLDIHCNDMHHRNKTQPHYLDFLKGLVGLKRLTIGKWLHTEFLSELPKLKEITVL